MREDGRETVVPTTMAIKPPLTAASTCGSKYHSWRMQKLPQRSHGGSQAGPAGAAF